MKIFWGLRFSDFIMRDMPSIVKQGWTNPIRFSFLPLKAIFSLISVKFSLMKTLVFWLKPCFSLYKFCNFFFVQQCTLTTFPVQKIRCYFFDLFLCRFLVGNTCSELTIVTLEQGGKYVKSYQQRHHNEANGVVLVSYC